MGGRKAHETSITDHIADIAALKNSATDYWLLSGADDPEQVVTEAARVQIALAAVMAFREVAPQYFSNGQIEEYSRLMKDLHRTVTGGEFETSGRSRSPATAIDIARQCASLTHYLRNSRSTIYGISLQKTYDRFSERAPVILAGAQAYTAKCHAWLRNRRN